MRRWLLQSAFELLYRRLGFLHETAGRVACGAAWDGRRRHVIPTVWSGTLLDVGCGEGRLLHSLDTRNVFGIGIEPSPVMAGRARRRHVSVIQATAQALPLQAGSVRHLVATYPGPWIVDPQTWDEIARVTEHGATIRVLLGGDIDRGRGAAFRSLLHRLAYGKSDATDNLPALGNQLIRGEYLWLDDEWGQAILWTGVRSESPT